MLMTDILTSPGPITIAQALPTDVDAVVAILTGASAWLTSRGIDQWGPGSFTRERGAEAIERGVVYVAKRRGEIVATLRLQWSEEALWGGRPGGAGYVHRLAVDRAYAGQGIGLSLLRWAEDQVAAMGLPFLRLDCMAGNPALRDYYLRAGFTFVDEVMWESGWRAALFEREVQASDRAGDCGRA